MEKYDIALDLIEHPEKYSDREIASFLEDDEIREIYNSLCLVETSFQPEIKLPEDKVEEEWNKFSVNEYLDGKDQRISRIWRSKRKYVAAALIAVVAMGAVALEIVIKQKAEEPDSLAAKENLVDTPSGGQRAEQQLTDSENKLSSDTTLLYENENLETILNDISDYYGTKLKIEKPASMSIRLFFRWETKSGKEEVIRRLNNFEKINLILEKDTIIVR